MSVYHCIEIECGCCSLYDDVYIARYIDKFKFVLMLFQSHRLQFNHDITHSRKLKSRGFM
jgi:hypothetical protein